MSARVQAAVAGEEEVRRNLTNELAVALRGVDVELKLTTGRVEMLSSQLQDMGRRLDKLAVVRAKYSNLNDEIHHRQQMVYHQLKVFLLLGGWIMDYRQ